MILLIYLTIIFGSIGAYLYRKYNHISKLGNKLPGPSPIPIIGNGLIFFNKSSTEIFKEITTLVNAYGNTIRVWMGPFLLTLICDPKDVEIVLSSSQLITKSQEYAFMKPWLNEGLLLSTGHKWLTRRKAITPTFHFKILNSFVNIFNDQSDVFVGQLKTLTQANSVVDIFPMVTLYALDVICGE